MSKRKVHHEEHADETWLIPYSDMLTLLLALFIVMFAMGEVDKQKLEKIGNQFNIIFSGGGGILEKEGSAAIPSPNPSPTPKNTPGVDLPIGVKTETQIEDRKMKEIMRLLEKEIGEGGYADKIKLVLNPEALEISIQDTVLFASGQATLLKDVVPILDLMAKIFSEIDNNIKVVGHTDNVPIKNNQFRSNWDLSAMRAINVMESLIAKGNLRPERFIIQGNGEYSPKYDNSTAAGRDKNRRVEIFIIRMFPLYEETTPVYRGAML